MHFSGVVPLARIRMNAFDLSFAGKAALGTGAGAGAGRAIAMRLARAGCAVAVNDSDPARAEATVSELCAAGATAVAVPADARVDTEVEAMVAAVGARLGGLDAAVNDGGMVGRHGAQPFLSRHRPARPI